MTLPFPDITLAFQTILVAEFPVLAPVINADPNVDNVYRVGEETPVELKLILGTAAAPLHFVRLGWLAGGDNGVTTFGVLDVENFAPTRAAAHGFAQLIREAIRPGPHKAGSVIIDSVDTQQAPTRLPWPDPTIRRYYASYRVSARR